MRVLIAAVGKAKASPEQALYLEYAKRLPWKMQLKECTPKRTSEESPLLLDACKGYDCIVALDETGKQFSSRELAEQIKHWQNQGYSSAAFIIGGADGLDDSVRRKAHVVWSLGKPTWPHMLVRAMLAEQLYRAWSIIEGHPYHRD